MIFTIAWRNIFRHKGKTLVIGTILFLGALIMTIGNGIIAGLNKGLEENIVNSFTGHILLISEKQKSDAVLLSMTGQTTEPIKNYPEIKEALSGLPYIKGFLPGGIGYVWVLNEKGQPIDQYILGVDFLKYNRFFNESITAVEGRLLKNRERGVLVPDTMRKWLYDFCNYWVIPRNETLNKEHLTDDARKDLAKYGSLDLRDKLVFMGLSKKNSTLDILSEIKGIIKFRSLNSLLGFYSILDVESFRECMGYFTAQDAKEEVPEEHQNLLEMDDAALFVDYDASFDTVVETDSLEIDSSVFKKIEKEIPMDTNIEEGVYNLIFIKLADGVAINDAIKSLNDFSIENNLGIRAVRWDKAIGIMGQMSVIMKSALLLFVGFIFFVAIIIIMNTLSMAAMERVPEIGMMRAVGARKWFISKMFLMETFILSASFGGLGIVSGAFVVKVLAGLKLTTENEVLQIFYGGTTFNPIIDLGSLTSCVIQLLIVTGLAVIYPVLVARKIRALDAISRE